MESGKKGGNWDFFPFLEGVGGRLEAGTGGHGDGLSLPKRSRWWRRLEVVAKGRISVEKRHSQPTRKPDVFPLPHHVVV